MERAQITILQNRDKKQESQRTILAQDSAVIKAHKLFSSYGGLGAQWLSGRMLDSRPRGRGLEPHQRHCVVSLSKTHNPSLVLVHPRETHPYITERLLMGLKESNQTNPIGVS